MSLNFQQKTDTVNYTVFESMQTIMDYFEESLENLMLPASEGKKLPSSNKVLRSSQYFVSNSKLKLRFIILYQCIILILLQNQKNFLKSLHLR